MNNSFLLAIVLIAFGAMGYFSVKVIAFDPNVGSDGASINPPHTVTQHSTHKKSVAIATKYWESKGISIPCRDIAGLVVERIPNWQGIVADGGARQGRCEILMRRGWYEAALHEPEKFCALVMHETGHIGGRKHHPNPGNIMHHPMLVVAEPCRAL